MTHADQLRDLADVVEAVEAGPSELVDADLHHRDDQAVAEVTVEVPLPLDGAGGGTPAEQDTIDDAADPIPVTALTEHADGLGESITTRLEEAGYETVADVTGARRSELSTVPQLGPKTVDQVRDAAEALAVDTPPTEDPDPPAWTPDNRTGGIIAPTRTGQKGGEKP